MPGWLTTVLLALLLTLLSYKLAVRGVKTFRQESKDIAATHAAQEQACQLFDSVLHSKPHDPLMSTSNFLHMLYSDLTPLIISAHLGPR